MRLGGRHVREACEVLGWSRYDLQRRTALPLAAVDLLMRGDDTLNGTRADEIILKHAFHRAGLALDVSGTWKRSRVDPDPPPLRTRADGGPGGA